jgi:hypothetical protein
MLCVVSVDGGRIAAGSRYRLRDRCRNRFRNRLEASILTLRVFVKGRLRIRFTPELFGILLQRADEHARLRSASNTVTWRLCALRPEEVAI